MVVDQEANIIVMVLYSVRNCVNGIERSTLLEVGLLGEFHDPLLQIW